MEGLLLFLCFDIHNAANLPSGTFLRAFCMFHVHHNEWQI